MKVKLLKKEDIKIELPDYILIKMYKIELRSNLYLNRGYILDGFPENYYQAFSIFKKKVIVK